MSKNKNPFQQGRRNTEFANGNVADANLTVKKSLPEAARFTEPDQNRRIRQRGN